MNPIILALDYPDLQEADDMLSKVRPHIGMIKIGLELFTAHGWETLSLARTYNIPVFLDLKLHDVPTTVRKTVEVVCSKLSAIKGDHFLSIHCLGSEEMCKQALEVSSKSNVLIAGVTLLTSLETNDLWNMGYKDTRVGPQTSWIARTGYDIGMKHFVCSPQQASLMRKTYKDSILITPGIRAEGEDVQDHKRAKPASFALKNGANWLVIGRPITQAANPEIEAQNFAETARRYSNY